MDKPIKAYFSLGSNIDPEKHIKTALKTFTKDFRRIRVSKIISSQAVGFDGDDFLNAVVVVCTNKTMDELLSYAEGLEKTAGRIRAARGRFDSRTLDVDLLIYGDVQKPQCGYRWPSSDVLEMAHVLGPLAEVAGDDIHPVNKQCFSSLWKEFDKRLLDQNVFK